MMIASEWNHVTFKGKKTARKKSVICPWLARDGQGWPQAYLRHGKVANYLAHSLPHYHHYCLSNKSMSPSLYFVVINTFGCPVIPDYTYPEWRDQAAQIMWTQEDRITWSLWGCQLCNTTETIEIQTHHIMAGVWLTTDWGMAWTWGSGAVDGQRGVPTDSNQDCIFWYFNLDIKEN